MSHPEAVWPPVTKVPTVNVPVHTWRAIDAALQEVMGPSSVRLTGLEIALE